MCVCVAGGNGTVRSIILSGCIKASVSCIVVVAEKKFWLHFVFGLYSKNNGFLQSLILTAQILTITGLFVIFNQPYYWSMSCWKLLYSLRTFFVNCSNQNSTRMWDFGWIMLILIYIYIYIYIYVCACVCVFIIFFFIIYSQREKKYFKMNSSTQRFMFIERIIYFVLSYEYVSGLLLSSGSI